MGRARCGADHVRLQQAGRASVRARSTSGLASTSLSSARSCGWRSASGTVAALVAFRYMAPRSSHGNIDVVAPSSAPMLVIVALPVALMVRAPGPCLHDRVGAPATVSWPAT
jgi:hypothetical protein